MQKTRIAAAFGVAALLLFMILVWSQPAHAQCGLPGTPDCAPGEKDKNKKPTPTDVPAATATPAPGFTLVPFDGSNTSLPTILAPATATIDPNVYATARACWDALYRQTPDAALPTASWGDIQYDAPQCIPTTAPTKVPPISLTHVAGPVFVPPGVKNVIIAVLIIGVLLIGVLLIARRLRPPNPNKPPGPPTDSLRPPGPPTDSLIPPGPPIMPSDSMQPPGPPIMPSDSMQPPGPPVMPGDSMQPPGPPTDSLVQPGPPTDSLRPPGPPNKPPSPN